MRIALVCTLLVVLLSSRAEAGRGTSCLKYLPDDATAVLAVDVARARGSTMFEKLLAVAREESGMLDALASAQPLDKLVDTVVIATDAAMQTTVIVVEGRIAKLVGEVEKVAARTETHAGVTYWVIPDGEAAVVDGRLVFASAGAITGVIDRAKDKAAKGPAALRTILAATARGAAVFGGAVVDGEARAELRELLGGEARQVAFSCAMTRALTIDVRLELADEATARTAVKTVADLLTAERRGQLEAFVGKGFADSLTVAQERSFARVSAILSREEIDKLVAFAKLAL